MEISPLWFLLLFVIHLIVGIDNIINVSKYNSERNVSNCCYNFLMTILFDSIIKIICAIIFGIIAFFSITNKHFEINNINYSQINLSTNINLLAIVAFSCIADIFNISFQLTCTSKHNECNNLWEIVNFNSIIFYFVKVLAILLYFTAMLFVQYYLKKYKFYNQISTVTPLNTFDSIPINKNMER